jgi:hypothetical protein
LAVPFAAEVVDHDASTFGGEQKGVGPPETPASASDDGDLAVEQTHETTFLFLVGLS